MITSARFGWLSRSWWGDSGSFPRERIGRASAIFLELDVTPQGGWGAILRRPLSPPSPSKIIRPSGPYLSTCRTATASVTSATPKIPRAEWRTHVRGGQRAERGPTCSRKRRSVTSHRLETLSNVPALSHAGANSNRYRTLMVARSTSWPWLGGKRGE